MMKICTDKICKIQQVAIYLAIAIIIIETTINTVKKTILCHRNEEFILNNLHLHLQTGGAE